ncbi:hypothetical protein QYE76_041233 [Lolium multiflorum]|uniref:Uncharacterized protein n=1 Tax=Lolium multiflorum TaxID=4521 RepID=A0AAD8WTS8_LOLMU|nr:hypothetical protein QYE76_041233 [Lolium multiflorum]
MEAGRNDRLNAFLAARGVPKETPHVTKKPPLPAGEGGGGGGGWDDWDDEVRPDMRQNQSAGSFRNSGAYSGRQPTRSRSTQDMYTKQELEASAASKEDFFARRMEENESKPQGIPPSLPRWQVRRL